MIKRGREEEEEQEKRTHASGPPTHSIHQSGTKKLHSAARVGECRRHRILLPPHMLTNLRPSLLPLLIGHSPSLSITLHPATRFCLSHRPRQSGSSLHTPPPKSTRPLYVVYPSIHPSLPILPRAGLGSPSPSRISLNALISEREGDLPMDLLD